MLVFLNKASIAGSMVTTLSHCNNGIAPLFVVSTPHEAWHCLVQPMALGCNGSLLGAMDKTPPGLVTTKGTRGSISVVVASTIQSRATVDGDTRGFDLGKAAPLSGTRPMGSLVYIYAAGVDPQARVATPTSRLPVLHSQISCSILLVRAHLVGWSSSQGMWITEQCQLLSKSCALVQECQGFNSLDYVGHSG